MGGARQPFRGGGGQIEQKNGTKLRLRKTTKRPDIIEILNKNKSTNQNKENYSTFEAELGLFCSIHIISTTTAIIDSKLHRCFSSFTHVAVAKSDLASDFA